MTTFFSLIGAAISVFACLGALSMTAEWATEKVLKAFKVHGVIDEYIWHREQFKKWKKKQRNWREEQYEK